MTTDIRLDEHRTVDAIDRLEAAAVANGKIVVNMMDGGWVDVGDQVDIDFSRYRRGVQENDRHGRRGVVARLYYEDDRYFFRGPVVAILRVGDEPVGCVEPDVLEFRLFLTSCLRPVDRRDT